MLENEYWISFWGSVLSSKLKCWVINHILKTVIFIKVIHEGLHIIFIFEVRKPDILNIYLKMLVLLLSSFYLNFIGARKVTKQSISNPLKLRFPTQRHSHETRRKKREM